MNVSLCDAPRADTQGHGRAARGDRSEDTAEGIRRGGAARGYDRYV